MLSIENVETFVCFCIEEDILEENTRYYFYLASDLWLLCLSLRT